jgi:phospholipid/cholesterol/gamma-HCH transport system permease protein
MGVQRRSMLSLRLEALGEAAELAGRAAIAGAKRFWKLDLVRQLDSIAVASLPIVVLTAMFSSMVMTFQIGMQFQRFGSVHYVGPVVTIAIFRELGPVITTLTAGARVGAGIAAEIGAMKVTDQVAAMRAMGADPIEKLVSPRILACIIAFPMLAVLSDVLGVAGAMLISYVEYSVDPIYFFNTTRELVFTSDFLGGIVKTAVFGLIVGTIACYQGLAVRAGTREVGAAATKTVVASSVAVLFADFIMTAMFYRINW